MGKGIVAKRVAYVGKRRRVSSCDVNEKRVDTIGSIEVERVGDHEGERSTWTLNGSVVRRRLGP
jgi:hypothetical protein